MFGAWVTPNMSQRFHEPVVHRLALRGCNLSAAKSLANGRSGCVAGPACPCRSQFQSEKSIFLNFCLIRTIPILIAHFFQF